MPTCVPSSHDGPSTGLNRHGVTETMSDNFERILASMLGLPRWVQGWMAILFGMNMASFAFLDTRVGMWTAAAFAVVASLNMTLMFFQGGLTRLLSFPHFVWLPLMPYLLLNLYGVEPLPPGNLRTFATGLLFVNSISLVFDTLEAIRWIRGGREVLGQNSGPRAAASHLR